MSCPCFRCLFTMSLSVSPLSVLEFRLDHTIAVTSASDATPMITDSLTSILPPPRTLHRHIKHPLRPQKPHLPSANSTGAALSWQLMVFGGAGGVRRHGLTSITVKDDHGMCSPSRCHTFHEACRANDRDSLALAVRKEPVPEDDSSQPL